MRPDEFLVLSEAMLRSFPIPAGHRSAISRAYYAAHHHIKAFIERMGVTVNRGPEAHSDVWNHLANINDIDLEQVGSDLSDLRADRNKADYHLNDAASEKAATAALLIALAKGLIADVDGCEKDPPRYKKVKAAIIARNRVLRGLK
jgi:uncharacterized protein (UPF0332 family)